MRVAIEVEASGVVRGGTLYVRKLLEEYAKMSGDDSFIVFGWAFRDPGALRRQFPVPEKPNFAQAIQRWPQSLVQRFEWDWRLPILKTMMAALGVDVYHCFRVPARRGPRVVMTVPDVWPLVRPEWYKPEHVPFWENRVKPGIFAADALVTYSEATKRHMVELLKVPGEKIHITPLGIDKTVFRPVETKDIPADLRARLNLPERFLLMVGPFDLLSSFAAVCDALKAWSGERPKIVCVGPIDDYVRGLQKLAEEKGVDACFQWIGFLPQKELVYLYNLTEALVYPSRLPGVELPPYEAMACGAAVITSLDECVGDAGIVVDADSPAQIGAAMKRVWESRAEADRLRPKALARAEQYTWKRCAETTLDAYRAALR